MKKKDMNVWKVKVENLNRLQISMKTSPNERGPSISPSWREPSTKDFSRFFLNLKRNNGDIKAQSFNEMMNKMAKSSIKMKNPQLNLKRENLY